MKHFFLLASLLVLFPFTSALSRDNIKDIANKLEAINKLLDKAVRENDYETQLRYFTDDVVIDGPLTAPIKGIKTLEAQFKKNVEEGVVFHSFSGSIEDITVCGDNVYTRGTWEMTQSSKKMKNPVEYYGSYLLIWEKHNDSYLIKFEIFTLDYNPFDLWK